MAFNNVPTAMTNINEWCRKIAATTNSLLMGKSNNSGTFTVTPNSATTVVTLPHGVLGQDSVIVFTPTTTAAATEFGAGTIHNSSRDVLNNTFTITHVNSAVTTRTFSYVLVG